VREAIVAGNDGEMRDLARLSIAAFGRRGEGSGVVGVDVQRIRRTLGLTAGAQPPNEQGEEMPPIDREQLNRIPSTQINLRTPTLDPPAPRL